MDAYQCNDSMGNAGMNYGMESNMGGGMNGQYDNNLHSADNLTNQMGQMNMSAGSDNSYSWQQMQDVL